MNQVKQWVAHSVEGIADRLMAWRKGLLALFVLLSLGRATAP